MVELKEKPKRKYTLSPAALQQRSEAGKNNWKPYTKKPDEYKMVKVEISVDEWAKENFGSVNRAMVALMQANNEHK